MGGEKMSELLHPMERPVAWGAFHAHFFFIGIPTAILLAFLLRQLGKKGEKRLFLYVGMFLIVSEIFKQIAYTSIEGSYRFDLIPFQLCSIPMYMCLIAPWMKPGKLQRGMYSFMVLYNLLGGAISFTEPSGLLHGYWFLTLHACIWHMLLVFVGLFICMSKRGGNEKSDYKGATFTFIVLCGIAFGLNCFVQLGLGEHMNMFFVGPGNSPIIVFKQFSEWLGWYINTPIYMFAVSLGAYLLFVLIYWLQHKELPIRVFSKKVRCKI